MKEGSGVSVSLDNVWLKSCGVPVNYPEFIKVLHHDIMGNTKELFRIFRINEKVITGARSIINPLKLGFSPNLARAIVPPIDTLILDNIDTFTQLSGQQFDRFNIVLPLILHDFHTETQNYLLDRVASEALRNWIEQFFVRKRISTTIGAAPLIHVICLSSLMKFQDLTFCQ